MGNAQARLSTPSTNSTSAKADLIKRQTRILFSAYRRDEFADPEGFIAQLGVVLEGYADAVILAVTSPRTGIQRRLKWPPSIAEVVEACDAEAAQRARVARHNSMPPFRRLPPPAMKPESGTSYHEMVKRYGRPVGPFEESGDQWNRALAPPPLMRKAA
jgi:hypothetical protein